MRTSDHPRFFVRTLPGLGVRSKIKKLWGARSDLANVRSKALGSSLCGRPCKQGSICQASESDRFAHYRLVVFSCLIAHVSARSRLSIMCACPENSYSSVGGSLEVKLLSFLLTFRSVACFSARLSGLAIFGAAANIRLCSSRAGRVSTIYTWSPWKKCLRTRSGASVGRKPQGNICCNNLGHWTIVNQAQSLSIEEC